MRSSIVTILALSLLAATSYAGVTINGTTITFNDATMQSTANPPSDHGGTGNTVSGADAFVGGGKTNTASGYMSAIAGGFNNTATTDGATVVGGFNNDATGTGGVDFVGGGNANVASGGASAIAGGNGNHASGYESVIGGGNGNIASAQGTTVGGGDSNEATATGATIPGGTGNYATGINSFAAGDGAYAKHNNSFVWGGATGGYRVSAGADTFNVWALGIYFNGVVHLPSDRHKKEAFSFVSAREVLDKVIEMPVTSWRFKNEDNSVRHIGPMAQDFAAAFGYGTSDKHIVGTDADGVALAAIQGLNAKLEEQRIEEEAKRADADDVITALRWQNAQLQARLARLEKAILKEEE